MTGEKGLKSEALDGDGPTSPIELTTISTFAQKAENHG